MSVHVILFGKSGSGKSTITNALLGDNIVETGDGFKGVTLSCNTYTSKSSEYVVVDTIGIGETEHGSIPHQQAVEQLENFLTTLTFPLHHVCFVKEAGIFDAIDENYWNVFLKIFGNCKRNFIVIITKAKEGWANENRAYLTRIIGNIPIIDVDFPNISQDPIEERILSQTRDRSINKLKSSLHQMRHMQGYMATTPDPSPSIARSIVSIFSKGLPIEKKKYNMCNIMIPCFR